MAGRSKGTPKTGGRQKGTPNKATAGIRKAAQAHGLAALKKLVALTKSKNETVVLAACNAILDRAYGRPAQVMPEPDGENVLFSFIMNLAPKK